MLSRLSHLEETSHKAEHLDILWLMNADLNMSAVESSSLYCIKLLRVQYAEQSNRKQIPSTTFISQGLSG